MSGTTIICASGDGCHPHPLECLQLGGCVIVAGVIAALFGTIVLAAISNGFRTPLDANAFVCSYGLTGGITALALIFFAMGRCCRR